ncbi:DUF6273 domain-containing protein [uncultured Anaerococcus sp.]|uniref:DUF6273 domain-containing protein n=1 Tax=uncultured Anaerococcus sp. TaxID=293428 RepID=UPI002889F424|nr:DUF6273 domain-containing protein [uncultured Anaerococcus sp.]
MTKRLGDLEVGTLVKYPGATYYGKPIIWKIADKNHEGYPSNSVTLISDKIIAVKAFDAKEPRNSNDSRQRDGNNYYKYSNISQWLNSDSVDWYKPTHSYDEPPTSENTNYGSPYDKEAGFLTNLSECFKKQLMETSIKIVNDFISYIYIDSMETKIFLASMNEVGLAFKEDKFEGSILALFENIDNRRVQPTDEAIKNTTYTHSDFSKYDRWSWWTRTPYDSEKYKDGVNIIKSDGTSTMESAYYSKIGIRPLCNLKADSVVSNYSDSDDIYTLKLSSPATIESSTSTSMGVKEKEFQFDYKVVDKNFGKDIKVEEYINYVKVKEFTAKSGAPNTFKLERLAYQKLPNGNHKVKIVAIDSEKNVTEKVFNFSKNETKILFELEKPLEADGMVTKALITMVGSIPEKAILKVETCNNGHDKNPTWEDVTTKVIKERKIFFANKKKTAAKWGVNVRVSVERNGAEGQCQILSIGGNFE